MEGGGNNQWWPDKLNLRVLAHNPDVIRPRGGDFDYDAALADLDVDALVADVKAVMRDDLGQQERFRRFTDGVDHAVGPGVVTIDLPDQREPTTRDLLVQCDQGVEAGRDVGRRIVALDCGEPRHLVGDQVRQHVRDRVVRTLPVADPVLRQPDSLVLGGLESRGGIEQRSHVVEVVSYHQRHRIARGLTVSRGGARAVAILDIQTGGRMEVDTVGRG